MKIERIGVGTQSGRVYNTGRLNFVPIQLDLEDGVSARVLGRVANNASWVELIAETSESTIESIAWIPYLQLDIVSGDGKATLFIGEI